ncbi:MAG: acyl-CoA synthetase FdrA [Elusimicrobiota bacterium]
MLKNIVRKNAYYDSVFLMALTNQVKSIPGILDCAVMMATPSNKELLEGKKLLTAESSAAGPNDLLICLNLEDRIKSDEIIQSIDELFKQKISPVSDSGADKPVSIDSALDFLPDANIVSISVPGTYVRYLGMKALKRGLNLFVFSDNVTIEEEIELKKFATEHGLIVMGPDCGTAIINGKAFGFANAVNRGNVGIAAAAGTGLQELSVLINNCRLGISQAIGLGGRDLKEKVGGLSMLWAIKMLEEDENTHLIVLVSKPPAPSVEQKVLDYISKNCRKKYIINFLGGNPSESERRGLLFADTIERAARQAAKMSGAELPGEEETADIINLSVASFRKNEKYLRGLFSGGTLCDEAQIVLKDFVTDVYSNVAVQPEMKLKNSRVSEKNSIIDLGDDEFTAGRPHPMIDNTLRKERIIQEAKDPQTAVILFDVVLGYGAHIDPAGELLPAIEEARRIARAERRNIIFISHVCGTEKDPQVLSLQEKKLKDAGVVVLATNALAARVAGAIIKGRV